MGVSPLDLISAHPWRRAAFTTYALSLSFFEAVLLDALVRGGGRGALILADIQGVRASLSEQGARRVGREYEVEPVAVATGVFHPKVSVLCTDEECHLLVGSGNLTFGGWGGNFEVIEHLHPSFAADAILDTAEFFDRLANAGHIRHGATSYCHTLAEELRTVAHRHRGTGDIRLYHSLGGTISESIAQAVQDLGGARQLIVASPFWDGGTALDSLCKSIGLDHAYVHVHPGGSVRGTAGSNWPTHTKITVRPILLHAMSEEQPRPLHAKAFEVICKRGRLLLSGSPNATMAALGANHNVEACVARIQRQRTVGWRFSKAKPPELYGALESEDDSSADCHGVLRAELEGDLISGQVLAPQMHGKIAVIQITIEGRQPIGNARLDSHGNFQIRAPGLELQSWKGGRLILRVESADGRAAEGFISVSAFAEVSRRAGAFAARLFAILTGTETPADVAAIISWLHEDPRRLGVSTDRGIYDGAGSSGNRADADATIAVAELTPSYFDHLLQDGDPDEFASPRWSRFMEQVLAAFRERRGPLGPTAAGHKGEDEDDDDVQGIAEPSPADPALDKSFAALERFLELLLSPENAPRHAVTAFDCVQYVCERLRPDSVRASAWLEKLITKLIKTGVTDQRRADVAAAILTQLGARSEPGGDRLARARLLALRFDVAGLPPPPDLAQGFQSVLIQTAEFADLWRRMQSIRTYAEQARAYLSALESGQQSHDYDVLLAEVPQERRFLEEAVGSPKWPDRILPLPKWTDACPRCHRMLPTGEVQSLRTKSIATARNCCCRILIWPGD